MIRRLNDMGAKTYYQQRGKNKEWNATTIRMILSNPVYIGKKVLGCSRTEFYKGRKRYMLPEEEWYVIENDHKAIVTESDFEAVQELLKNDLDSYQEKLNNSKDDREKMHNLFKGKIICADCGGIMYFHKHKATWKNGCAWYGDYECSTHQRYRNDGCFSHGISKRILDNIVLTAVKDQINAAVEYEKVITQFRQLNTNLDSQKKLDSSIKGLKGSMNSLKNRRQSLYEDYVEGILSEEEYLYAKGNYDNEYDRLAELYENACVMKKRYNEAVSSDNRWIALMKQIRNADELTQELVDMAVEKVKVYHGGKAEIVMKYQDIYELTCGYVKEIKESDIL